MALLTLACICESHKGAGALLEAEEAQAAVEQAASLLATCVGTRTRRWAHNQVHIFRGAASLLAAWAHDQAHSTVAASLRVWGRRAHHQASKTSIRARSSFISRLHDPPPKRSRRRSRAIRAFLSFTTFLRMRLLSADIQRYCCDTSRGVGGTAGASSWDAEPSTPFSGRYLRMMRGANGEASGFHAGSSTQRVLGWGGLHRKSERRRRQRLWPVGERASDVGRRTGRAPEAKLVYTPDV